MAERVTEEAEERVKGSSRTCDWCECRTRYRLRTPTGTILNECGYHRSTVDGIPGVWLMFAGKRVERVHTQEDDDNQRHYEVELPY